MGFHISCSGVELLNGLRKDASNFLREPYSLYFIALATGVDDEVLKWLHEHEMQLDSLSGPCAAFLLFYNEARLMTKRPPIHPGYQWPLPENTSKELIELDINSAVLNGGYAEVVNVLRKYDSSVSTDKDILLRSMTYESDTIARELGIIDKLPCLVVFDDPSTDIFYVLPLIHTENDIMQDLRLLISMFMADPAHVEYLKLLSKWHAENDSLRRLQTRYQDMLPGGHNPVAYICSSLGPARELLLAGRVKDFRAALNMIEGKAGHVGYLPWKKIRKETNNVSEAISLYHSLQITDVPKEYHQRKLDRALQFLQLPQSTDIAKARQLLHDAVVHTTDAIIDLILDSLNISRQEGMLPDPICQIEEEIKDQENIVKELGNLIALKKRPSLSRHVKELQRKKHNNAIIRRTKNMAVDVSGRIPSILDIASKVVELFT
jgi:hypothetical protein